MLLNFLTLPKKNLTFYILKLFGITKLYDSHKLKLKYNYL